MIRPKGKYMDVSAINHNSAQMFQIINEAQKQTTSQSEKIIEISLEAKLDADMQHTKGQVINMLV